MMALVRICFIFIFCWTIVLGYRWRPLGVTSLRTSPYVAPQKDDFLEIIEPIITKIGDSVPDVTVRTNGSAKIFYWVEAPRTGTTYEVCVNHCPNLNKDDLSTIWKDGKMQANMVRAKGFQTFGTYTYRLMVNTDLLDIRVQALDWRGDAHTTVSWMEDEHTSQIASIRYIGIETVYGGTSFKISGLADVIHIRETSTESTTPLRSNETAWTPLRSNETAWTPLRSNETAWMANQTSVHII